MRREVQLVSESEPHHSPILIRLKQLNHQNFYNYMSHREILLKNL
jgi:hypothetical protein